MENRVNVSPEERNNPSEEQFDELLEMLKEANAEGQLAGFVFMLKDPESDMMVVDYRGSHEHVEIATREVRVRIRDEIQQTHPHIARQLTAELEAKVH
jgi:FPC/CPF motif-containing protein YcgG